MLLWRAAPLDCATSPLGIATADRFDGRCAFDPRGSQEGMGRVDQSKNTQVRRGHLRQEFCLRPANLGCARARHRGFGESTRHPRAASAGRAPAREAVVHARGFCAVLEPLLCAACECVR
eukprot:1406546-Prymnesium_polylepis.1